MASIKGLDKVALYLLLPSLLYILYGVIWRLYLSPLAKYPGPRLAAITSWYEFYYDIIQPGRFPWEVQRLHDVYGSRNLVKILDGRHILTAKVLSSGSLLLKST